MYYDSKNISAGYYNFKYTALGNFYNENQDIADICLKKKDEKYYLSGERLEEMFYSIKNTIETIFLYFTGV